MADLPTPYSIALCALVNPEQSQEDIKLMEHLLHHCPSFHVSNTDGLGNWLYPSFSTLLQSIDSLTRRRSTGQELFKRLASISASVDDLVDFFECLSSRISSVPSTMNKATKSLDWTSIQGLYIRKQLLGYQILDFESVARLWAALCLYIHADEGALLSDSIENDTMLWPLSASQIEMRLKDKCLSLDLSATPHYSFVDHIKVLQSKYPQNPSLHFYEYLHSIQSKEFTTSYEAFYRYFDYSMIQERRLMAKNLHNLSTLPGAQKHGISGISSVLQYAPVELATLHAEFGYMDSAQMAAREAIRVAQQYHDGACVAYAMGCMPLQQQFATVGEGISDHRDILQRCVKRSMLNRLYHLASGTALTLAQHDTITTTLCNEGSDESSASTLAVVHRVNRNHPPRSIWNEVLSASTMTFSGLTSETGRHRGKTLDFGPYAQATNIPIHVPFSDIHATLAEQNLVSSAVWEIFGNRAMSFLLSNTVLEVYQDALSRMKLAMANHKCIIGSFSGHRSLFDPRVLSQANNPVPQECPKTSEDAYLQAFHVLVSVQKLYNPSYGSSLHTLFCFSNALLMLDWSVSKGRLYDSFSLGVLLNSAYDGGHKAYGGIVAFAQVTMLSCLTSRFFYRWEDARKSIRRLTRLASRQPLSFLSCKLIYQLCDVMLASDVSYPARVLPLLMECLSLCQRLCYDALHASAIGLLAKVFLSMGYWQKSIPLLRGSLPFVLAHASLDVQGELWLTLVKCYLLQIGQLKEHLSAKKGKMIKILGSSLLQINEAIVLFSKIKNNRLLKEAFYLKARICNDLHRLSGSETTSRKNYLQERNSASRFFRNICREETSFYCLPNGSYDLRRCYIDINHMEKLRF